MQQPNTKFTGKECVVVGDFPNEVTETELKAFLNFQGAMKDLFLPLNGKGISKGYAFVRFENERKAKEAKYVLDATRFRDNEIIVLKMVNPMKTDLEKYVVVKGILDIKQAILRRFLSQFGELISIKVDSERNEGFVKFKDKKMIELLYDTNYNENLDDNEKVGYRLCMENKEFFIEPYKKKKTLYFKNLSATPVYEIQELIKYIENEGHKVISVKFGYNKTCKHAWTFLTLETNEQAYEAFELFKTKKFKEDNTIDFVWPSKRDLKTNFESFIKIYTRTFHSQIKLTEIQNFFNQICPPDEIASSK